MNVYDGDGKAVMNFKVPPMFKKKVRATIIIIYKNGGANEYDCCMWNESDAFHGYMEITTLDGIVLVNMDAVIRVTIKNKIEEEENNG